VSDSEKVIQKLNSLIVLVGLMIFFLAGTYISTRIMLESIQIDVNQTDHKLTKISQQLEMFEEATPTGKEVIYLYKDEAEADYLNNDRVTGYTE